MRFIVALFVLLISGCYWQPPNYTVQVQYEGTAILVASSPGAINIIWVQGEFEKNLQDLLLDKEAIDITLKATKVSLGEYIDYGDLILEVLRNDNLYLADVALLNDSIAEIKLIVKR